jgi:hypothetical protein
MIEPIMPHASVDIFGEKRGYKFFKKSLEAGQFYEKMGQ